ncbi:unnamed protein product [Clavelina lepadiformis]|uniref:Uncharacterized protein n=1 Tax=Clavelina lepadiformis TaxID=159417 RepID=A0ABP0F6A3_CLALP
MKLAVVAFILILVVYVNAHPIGEDNDNNTQGYWSKLFGKAQKKYRQQKEWFNNYAPEHHLPEKILNLQQSASQKAHNTVATLKAWWLGQQHNENASH